MDFVSLGTDANGMVLGVISATSTHLGHIRKHDGASYSYMPSYKYKASRIMDVDMLRKIAVKLEMLNGGL